MATVSEGSGKPCRMCNEPVAKWRGRSREHVIPAWMQQEFGLARQTVSYSPLEADAVPTPLQGSVRSDQTPWRSHPFGSLLLGSVCQSCNNGWMSRLESRARPDLIRLIQAGAEGVEDPDGVALWGLKTAFTLTLATDPPIGRVPRIHGTYAASNAQGLPRGVNVLLHRSERNGWWFSSVSTFTVEVVGAMDDQHSSVAARAHQRNAYCYFLHLGRLLLIVRYWPDNRSTLTYDGTLCKLLAAGTRVVQEAMDIPDLDQDPLMDLVMSMRIKMDLAGRVPNDFCLCGSGVPARACAALRHVSDLAGNWGWTDA